MKNNNDLKRVPIQKRSINTKKKLLDAGYELFIKQGYYNTNSKEIASKAKVAIGSFYAYFNDKKDILIEIYTSITSEIRNDLQTIIVKYAQVKDKKEFVYNSVKSILERNHLQTVLFYEMQALAYLDKDIYNMIQYAEKELYAILKKGFLEWQDALVVKNLDYAIIITFKIFEQMTNDYLSHPKKYNKKEYFQEVTDLIYGYLFIKK